MVTGYAVRELPVNAHRVAPVRAASDELRLRVRADKARSRRRWLLRSLAALVLMGVLLVGLLIWQRNQRDILLAQERFQPVTAALQAQIDKWGVLPGSLPELTTGAYANSEQRFYARNTDQPVIVASSHPVRLLFSEDGRVVITYQHQQGAVKQEWLSASEYRSRLHAQNERMDAFVKKVRNRPPELP